MSDSRRALPDRPSLEQLRKQAKERLRTLRGEGSTAVLGDAQLALAREYGFDSWPKLVHHVERLRGPEPADDPRTAPHGLSRTPPFYRIDWATDTIEPRQPMTAADWDRLIAVAEDLGLSGVNARGQMDDDTLARLSRLTSVTRLTFDGTKRMTDEGLQHLANMPQLETLDISDYPGGRITDRGLEVVARLTRLRHFQMCWQSGVSDGGARHLAPCMELENVNLLGTPTGDGALDALRGKPRLRHLRTGRQVTDAGLRALHDFPVFKTWQSGEPRYSLMSFGDSEPNFLMLDGTFTDAGAAGLAGLEGIFGLGFFWHITALTPDGLRFLKDLPNLGALGCEGRLADDTGMRHIAAIPRLRMLMAQGTVATNAGFAALSRSRTIEYIWGRECPNLEGPGFAALAAMPSLQGLAVSCARVDDAALASLPSFPALTWLLPMDVRDEGFRHVGRCERLEKLTCMYCRDTGDAATAHIAGLRQLKHYYAGKTQITDRSLEILGTMTSLEDVQLSACAHISNAGLAHLAKLPRLKKVAVDATALVTRAGLDVFPPGVHVDFWS
jgi:hypothetical protein